jgi:biopolymer transport protein ExbD
VIAKKRRGDALPVNAEINLTNLIDIAFVLLIIFMITAPIMQGGIELNLPKADATPIEASDPVVVSITGDHRIFIDKAEVTMQELGTQMARFADGKRAVSLRMDKVVPADDFVRAMAIMNKAGVTNFGIIADQDDSR